MRLREIEKRILAINNILSDKTREGNLASGVVTSMFEGVLKNANRPFLEERLQLETERQFILDRREGLLWKLVWNVAIPVIVSVLTVYALKKLGLG